MEEKSCCFTGYRPSKFPFELSNGNREYNKFENALFCILCDLVSQGYRTFYTGMAMGFDIIAAENVLMLKKIHPQYEIKLVCVMPFTEQVSTFDEEWKLRHAEILKVADDIIISSDTYSRGCYSKRNKFMVDRSDTVITWYDGRSGGTQNTLGYAAKKNKYIINLNSESDYDYSRFEIYTVLDEEADG